MSKTISFKEAPEVKVKIEVDKYGDTLLLKKEYSHWIGVPITPQIAKLFIEALNEYLHDKA